MTESKEQTDALKRIFDQINNLSQQDLDILTKAVCELNLRQAMKRYIVTEETRQSVKDSSLPRLESEDVWLLINTLNESAPELREANIKRLYGETSAFKTAMTIQADTRIAEIKKEKAAEADYEIGG